MQFNHTLENPLVFKDNDYFWMALHIYISRNASTHGETEIQNPSGQASLILTIWWVW